MRRFFCDCCGKEITSKAIRYNVVLYDRQEKKENTILHLCSNDINKVRRMRFSPQKNIRKRNIPKFFNLVEEHEGKQKSLYIINEWDVEQVLTLNKKSIILFTESGRFYYTPEYIRQTALGTYKIKDKHPDEILMSYVQKLYERQTQDEKSDYETKWHNNKGFNKSDAKFMSAMARVSFDKGWQTLTESQLEVVRKRFIKYAEQVADIMNNEV